MKGSFLIEQDFITMSSSIFHVEEEDSQLNNHQTNILYDMLQDEGTSSFSSIRRRIKRTPQDEYSTFFESTAVKAITNENDSSRVMNENNVLRIRNRVNVDTQGSRSIGSSGNVHPKTTTHELRFLAQPSSTVILKSIKSINMPSLSQMGNMNAMMAVVIASVVAGSFVTMVHQRRQRRSRQQQHQQANTEDIQNKDEEDLRGKKVKIHHDFLLEKLHLHQEQMEQQIQPTDENDHDCAKISPTQEEEERKDLKTICQESSIDIQIEETKEIVECQDKKLDSDFNDTVESGKDSNSLRNNDCEESEIDDEQNINTIDLDTENNLLTRLPTLNDTPKTISVSIDLDDGVEEPLSDITDNDDDEQQQNSSTIPQYQPQLSRSKSKKKVFMSIMGVFLPLIVSIYYPQLTFQLSPTFQKHVGVNDKFQNETMAQEAEQEIVAFPIQVKSPGELGFEFDTNHLTNS